MLIKVITTALALASLTMASAQTGHSLIHGKVDRPNIKTVTLYRTYEGNMIQEGTQVLNEKGEYGFYIPTAKPGFYYIADNFGMQESRTRFYLKGNDDVELNIHDKGVYDMKSNTEENQLLDKWQQLSFDIYNGGFNFWSGNVTYVTFFPKLQAIFPKRDEFKKQINTKDPAFNKLMNFVVDNDVEAAAECLLVTPRTAHPSKEEIPDYYKSWRTDNKYCDATILQLGDAMRRLQAYTSVCLKFEMEADTMLIKKMKSPDFVKHDLSLLCNDTVKGAFFVSQLKSFRTLDALHDFAATGANKYLLTDSLKSRYIRYEGSLATLAKGEKALEFNYEDASGKKVSFASLKGKVVLIDTWATWCGPCRKEIPSLKQLTEELKDKNIAFVSLSVDALTDKDKWKKMVADERLTGIQLFAGGADNDFSKYYKVATIPRFLVFDKQGNILSSDAPRPSDPALKQMLLKAL